MISAWELVKAGGPMVWPVALCSVCALAVCIERLVFFLGMRFDVRAFLNTLFEHIKHNRIKEALVVCDAHRHPLCAVLKAGILKFDRPRQQIKEAMEDAALYEMPVLEKNLFLLSTIAWLSPLLGLLGTATGMLRYFYTVSQQAARHETLAFASISSGVWEALITTVFGLLVCVFAFTAHSFLVNRKAMIVFEIEKASTELVNFLTE